MVDINIVKDTQIHNFLRTKNNRLEPAIYLGGCLTLDSVSQDKGARTPIYCKDPNRRGRYIIIDTKKGEPALGETTISEKMPLPVALVVEDLYQAECEAVLYLVIDPCANPSDISTWTNVLLVDRAAVYNMTFNNLGQADGGAEQEVNVSGSANFIDRFIVNPVSFSEKAASTVVAEVVDIVFGDNPSCGDCGPVSNGCAKLYAVTKANAGSPGLSGQLIYTEDNFSTDATVDITPFGGNNADRLLVLGNNLIVISETAESHVWQSKNSPTASEWAEVTSGYVVGHGARALYAINTASLIIVGKAGYIYSTNNYQSSVSVVDAGVITATDYNDVHGAGNTIVAVAGSNTVAYSNNTGASFTTQTGPEIAATLLSVWVFNRNQWLIGTSTGKLWLTNDAGTSYDQIVLPDQSLIAAINRIAFSPRSSELGALALTKTGGAGSVYRTFTGGTSWIRNGDVGLSGLPTNDKINAVALCDVNEIAACGLAANGTDGIIATAE